LRVADYAAKWIDRFLQHSFSTLAMINKLPLGAAFAHPSTQKLAPSGHKVEYRRGLFEPFTNYKSDLVENSGLRRFWFKLPKRFNTERVDFSLGLPETSEVLVRGVAGLRAFSEPHSKMRAKCPSGVAVH